MAGTSKILTVSYGTFSCTLEGSDDSFGTMKAIAEYFRGLAADDRYFGAEPPTPDADVLAAIAGREIARRVDARMDESGIVLSPAPEATEPDSKDSEESAATVQAAEKEIEGMRARRAAKAVNKATQVVQEQQDATMVEQQTAQDTPETSPPILRVSDTLAAIDDAADPGTPEPESLAAKLHRIRTVAGTSSDRPEQDNPPLEEALEPPVQSTDLIALMIASNATDTRHSEPPADVSGSDGQNKNSAKGITSGTTLLSFAGLDGDLDDYFEDSDFTETEFALEDVDFPNDFRAKKAEQLDAKTATPDIKAEVETAKSEESSPKFSPQDQTLEGPAMDRLMSETDTQMNEPESSRRRLAIAHLKAAVAEKKAARQAGEPDATDQETESAFRSDLSEAVRLDGAPRPRPAVNTGVRTERPGLAPLQLVAEQRIDSPDTRKRDTPITPRRVAARTDDDRAQEKHTKSFAEFAENMGASELPDLLEAAAAYTSFVEGADEFSRPEILRRVRALTSDNFNREDGLRSFANLLQSGRITKVRNGRFQVADDCRFNPARRAG